MQTFDTLLGTIKALCDETRLKIACLLSQKAYSVTELADTLGLTAPTISHHLDKLREQGLVNLRVDGTSRFYRLNDETLTEVTRNLLTPAHLDEMANRILGSGTPEPKPDTDAWIEALDWDEADRKVLRDFVRDGRITQMPSKQKKQLVLLRWLATKFAANTRYPEREVNAILREVNPDYAGLRRDLVEFGFLQREGGGGLYWRAEEA